MPRQTFLRWLFLCAVVVLVMSACTDSSGDDSNSSAEATTTLEPSDSVGPNVVVGRSTGTILSAGLDREYVLHIPTGYDRAVPLPLLVVFHGYTMTAAGQESDSGLPSVGEEEGFITVFPEGRGDEQRWLFELDSAEIDISIANPDIVFVTDLLDKLSNELNVDTDQIYAVGFSNGGWMVSAVACTLSERFAAAAPVAGIMDFGTDCGRDTPMPMITFHGTSDRYEPFEGGVENAPKRTALPTDIEASFGDLPVSENPILDASVPDKVAVWANVNGCEGDPVSIEQDDVSIRWEYACADSASVVFHEVATGTHWWNITTGFDTNQWLWDFLSTSSN